MLLRSYRAAAVCGVLSFATALPAADVNWEGGVSSNWAVSGNWVGGALPTIDDTALISGEVTATVQTNVGTVDGVLVFDDGTLEIIAGGTLGTSFDVVAGNGTNGNLIQSGGTLNADGSLVLGAGGVGAFEKSGGATNFGDTGAGASLIVGVGSAGSVTMSGGTLTQGEVDLTSPASTNYIGLGPGTATLNLSDGDISMRTFTYVGGDGGATGVVNQTGGTFAVRERSLRIGGNGPGSNGTYNISGGQLATGTGLSVGYGALSSGEVNISENAEVQVGASIFLGIGDPANGATGVINQSGGTVNVASSISIGDGDLATGAYNQTGGVLNAEGGLYIGNGAEATGSYTITGGEVNPQGFTILGWSGSTNATMYVGGDAALVLGAGDTAFEVGGQTYGDFEDETPDDPNFGYLWGQETNGTLVQDGGSILVGGFLQVASGTRATGVYELNGGSLEVAGVTFLTIPQFGEFEPGVTSTGNATFTQTGGDSLFHDIILAGFVGKATMEVSGGTFVSDQPNDPDGDALVLGTYETSNGSSLSVSGGQVTLPNRLRVADGDADDIVVNVSGTGHLSIGGELYLGAGLDDVNPDPNPNHGTMNQSGGTVDVTGFAIIGLGVLEAEGVDSRSNGVYNMSGGVLNLTDTAAVGLGGTGEFIQTGGTVNAFAGIVLANFAGSEGNFELSGGTLELHRTGIELGDGDASFSFTGGRLSGAEALIMSVTQTGGTLSTGDIPNFTIITGDYNASGDAVVEIKLAGLEPAVGHDIFQVEGVATLCGTLSVVLADGFEPQVGDLFEVLTSLGGDIVGQFDSIEFASNPFNVTGQLIYESGSVILEIIEDTAGPLGDTDGDNDVDLDDLNNVRNNFGANGIGDTDGDNDVDLDDLNNVRNNFGAVGSADLAADLSNFGGAQFTSDLDLRSRLPNLDASAVALDYEARHLAQGGGPNPVPEPATWALGIISSLAGLVAFRRRKK